MTAIYLFDGAGALSGPVDLPEIPGLGKQLPGNAIVLAKALAEPAPGCVWVQVAGKRQQVLDKRGTVYRTVSGAAELYDQLGELPEGLTTLPRPSVAHRWQNDAWVKDPVIVHQEKVGEVNRGCEAAITRGFWSPALGTAHFYDSQQVDQLNLTGMILRGIDGPYPCRDELGQKEFRPHSADQLRQVGNDFTSYKLLLLQHADSLKQQLDQALSAGDVSAIEAVTWSEPQS
jgi:hypothetical protein